MESAHTAGESRPTGGQGWLKPDIAVVLAIPVLVAVLARRYEWNEALFALTRPWEHAQLDEWPIVVLALAIGLTWLSWRRSRQAIRDLHARRVAEEGLAAALAENKRLAHQNLVIQEAERKHLARELHDELAQYSNAIKLDAVAIAQDARLKAEPAGDAAQRILRAANHIHAAVGELIGRLRPAGLDELGLVAALENCVDHWRRSQPGTRFELTTRGNLDDLEEMATLAVYRLIQEGLTNCTRHAGARSVEIVVSRLPNAEGAHGSVVLSLRDDGRGADMAVRSEGFGLLGMKERVSLLGGKLSIDSAPGKGFNIEATLPALESTR